MQGYVYLPLRLLTSLALYKHRLRLMNIELLNGDCLELMKTIPDSSIDLILCDLPYGTTSCRWDSALNFNLLWEQYNRIITNHGTFVLFASEPFTSKLILSNIIKFKERLVWKKHKPSNMGTAKYRHMKYTEDIVIFGNSCHTFNPIKQVRISSRIRQAQRGNSKQFRTLSSDTKNVIFGTDYPERDWKTFDANKKYPGDILIFPAVVSNSKEKVEHPTQKPVSLLEYLIKTYSNEGEMVLDNCMGSGSTGVACINTGRNFIGIELDNDYFNIASQRINDAQKQ